MPTDPEPPETPAPPVVETVAPAPAVAPAPSTAPAHHAPLHTHCENCGTKLEGPFCHRCGQHDFDFKQGFGHALHDALENFFHFDTKLFRNVITLLFRPGVLSAEFNAGHRAAQMPPLRLYIFVSILFFFVSFAGGRMPKNALVHDEKPAGTRVGPHEDADETPAGLKKEAPGADAGKFVQFRPPPGEGKPANPNAAPKGRSAPAGAKAQSGLDRTLEEKGEYAYRHQHELAEAFVHAIPKMLLFCLPLFALYTRLLFGKAGLAYLQHFVVAVHFHTFIFLWLLFRDGWAGLASLLSPGLGGWVVFAAGVWLTIYPVLMLRRLFGNSWKRTLAKTAALAAGYSLTLGLAFAITALIVLAMI